MRARGSLIFIKRHRSSCTGGVLGQKKAAASAAEEMKVGAIGMCTTFE
jgi:hypothetical protein